MDITYTLTTGLSFVLSVIAFIFVLSWRHQRGQLLMLAFVTLGLIFPLLISLLLNTSVATGGFADLNSFWIYQLISTIIWLCQLVGSGFLLAYVAFLALANPKPNTRSSKQNIDGSHRYDASGSQNDFAATLSSPDQPTGPQWNVPPAPKLNVKILRQREWAFVIDILPFIIAIVITISILTSRFGSRGLSTDSFDAQLWALFWLLVVVQFPYALFKDCAGGRSLGKHFAGCRVVDFKSGKPAPVGQTIVRNLPFLIPLFSIVELATASIRPDSRRLGDLLAKTIVVTGPPDFIDGQAVEKPADTAPEPKKKHPLDD